MDDLVKITLNKIGDAEINSVNARELWKVLESKQEFSHWIKNRLEKTRYVDGIDYCRFDKIIKTEGVNVVKPSKEYIISIDMAKNFSMMEHTDIGDQVRLYFIESDKRRIELEQQHKLPQTYKEALVELLHQVEENERLQEKIAEDAPKVEFAEDVRNTTNTLSVNEFAKVLGTGRDRLFQFLRDNKIIYTNNTEKNMPYQKYLDLGWFKLVESTFDKPNGRKSTYTRIGIKGKGQQAIFKLWNKHNDQGLLKLN